MLTWIIAYANESTSYDWLKCGLSGDLQGAIDTARTWSTTSMQNSAIAIFAVRDNDPVDWRDKRPRWIHNRHVLTHGLPDRIAPALGSLINSFESDWF